MTRYSLPFFLFCPLAASIFFDDPRVFFYKRILYIIFVVLSIWQLYLFHYKRTDRSEDLPLPRWYPTYIRIFLLFVLCNMIVDWFNPAFSLVTLLNHPLATLTVVPVFAFTVGYQTEDMEPFIKFLIFTCVLFVIVFLFPMPGSYIWTQGMGCVYAVLPLTIFAFRQRRHQLLAIGMILVCLIFSQVSGSRTITLRILMFVGLLVAMRFCGRWKFLKVMVIVATGFCIYQFLTNLSTYLELFKSNAHLTDFDDEDTRTFIYTEVFGDLKPHEILFGRGFQGTYFSPYFFNNAAYNHDFSGDYFFRFSAEVGFLEFLLKGGVIYFTLYVTPLVTAVYKGLFTRHNSRIAFPIAVYILCELFLLFIENIPAYHFQFFIIFFLAGFVWRETNKEKWVPQPVLI